LRTRRQETLAPVEERPSVPLDRRSIVTWFLLSASGTALLLAVTNAITLDVAAVPFLWILPLSAYLLTFVLLFKRKPFLPRWLSGLFGWAVFAAATLHVGAWGDWSIPTLAAIGGQLLVLFVVCMRCHGLLVESKPSDPRQLTAFYVVLSIGGFAGSALVAWVVPLVFSSLVEYLGALALAALAVGLATVWRASAQSPATGRPFSFSPAFAGYAARKLGVRLGLLAVAGSIVFVFGRSRFGGMQADVKFYVLMTPLALALIVTVNRPLQMALVLLALGILDSRTEELTEGSQCIERYRDYYGIYKVADDAGIRTLTHGVTKHGAQYLSEPASLVPLSYYHPATPIGKLLKSNTFGLRDVGMIGLGTGATAAYMRAGQNFTVFELDPAIRAIAENHFTYLQIARRQGANIRFAFGDGRVSLRHELASSLDMLIVDAFSSDAIPTHLLTVEAIEEFFRVLRPDGLLVLHISNKIVNLEPVVAAAARQLGLVAVEKSYSPDVSSDADTCQWMAVCHRGARLARLKGRMGWNACNSDADRRASPWTDQYTDLFSLLWRGI